MNWCRADRSLLQAFPRVSRPPISNRKPRIKFAPGSRVANIVARRLVLVLFLSLSYAIDAMAITADTAALPKTLTVHFEGGCASANFAGLLVTLKDLIPLRPYIDQIGQTPANILRRNGELVGPYVPAALDLYLCSVNPSVCSIEKTTTRPRSPTECYSTIPPNTGTKWRNEKMPVGLKPPDTLFCPGNALPRYTVCIPDLKIVESKGTTVVYYTKGKDRLETIVTRRTGGCDHFDSKCKEIIALENRGKSPLEKGFYGPLNVPVQSYQLSIPIASAAHRKKLIATIDAFTEQRRAERALAKLQNNIYWTEDYSLTAQSTTPATPSTETAQPKPQDYTLPLRIMSYPFLSEDLLSRAKIPLIGVAVWESHHFEKDHCVFKIPDGVAQGPLIELDDPPPTAGEEDPPKIVICGTVKPWRNDTWDHATAVSALIAGRLNGNGFVGVNPYADLWGYSFEGTDFGTSWVDPVANSLYENHLDMAKIVSVVNLSFSVDSKDPDKASLAKTSIRREIDGHSEDLLFVAAAGNDNRLYNRDAQNCGVIPACYSLTADNVISVVALDSTGEKHLELPSGNTIALGTPVRLDGSNYGPAFDVGAVGTTVSALYGNAFGKVQGTSMAAPYVAGLASLIAAKRSRAPIPQCTKERICYTSDFDDTLETEVHFGRINFTRALNVLQAPSSGQAKVIDLEDGRVECISASPHCASVNGAIVRASLLDDSSSALSVVAGQRDGKPIEDPVPVNTATLRRLHAESGPHKYTIVYKVGSELHLIRHGVLDSDYKLSFRVPPGNGRVALGTSSDSLELQASEIRDYTAPMKCENEQLRGTK